ncbi:MAG: DUF3368 domain-containing protein [bacterium]
MIYKWVSNASPLILLQRIGYLYLLTDLCDHLVIPKGVIDEIFYYDKDAQAWEVFLASPKVNRLKNNINIEPSISGWDLGKGESEVLSWAVNNVGYEAVLDDLSARKCARGLDIPLRGTVGVILLAKKKKHISKVKPLIQLLIDAGLRFDNKWINEALSLVGEHMSNVE